MTSAAKTCDLILAACLSASGVGAGFKEFRSQLEEAPVSTTVWPLASRCSKVGVVGIHVPDDAELPPRENLVPGELMLGRVSSTLAAGPPALVGEGP